MKGKHAKIIEFIKKIYDTEEFIPLHAPIFLGNEKKYLNECIDTSFVSYVGRFVTQFEENIAAYCGSRYAIATVNGTVALQIALLTAGISKGDEVITQPFTFAATSNAIKHAGANPVYIDVDKDTLGMSPEKLYHFIQTETEFKATGLFNKTSGKQIKACVPVHVFGHPCRIEEIKEICDKYNIILIEDAAESIGSKVGDKHTGTYGLSGILSFNGNKTITSGGGGMILTDNKEIAKRAKHVTTTAKVPHPWEYIHDELGYNFRMPNINAAVGVAQLEKIDVFIKNKRRIADLYGEFLSSIGVTYVKEREGTFSNYWLNTVILDSKTEKEQFLKTTNDNGIMTRPAWKLSNELGMYKNCQCGNVDNSNWLQDRVVNIPSGVSKKLIK